MELTSLWFGICCLLTFCLPNFIYTLRLLETRVPNYVIKDSNAQLECLYDLETEALYSVKWYKDGNEFYRYMPMGKPKVETFPLPGIDVDLNTSDEANVTLSGVGFQSSGRYRCEISAEAPSFETVTDTAPMTVVVLPEHGNPRIYGARPRYQIGDWVQVNCTAGPSKPAVDLEWEINNKPATPHSLKPYPLIIEEVTGFESITLGLQFRVEGQLFQSGDLRLKCVASLKPFYWRSNEEVIEADRPQKAHVLDASIYTIDSGHSGADPVLGSTMRESFATKFLSLLTPTNAASRCHNANVLAIVLQLCLALLNACGGRVGGRGRGVGIPASLVKMLRKLISINVRQQRSIATVTQQSCLVCSTGSGFAHTNFHIRQSGCKCVTAGVTLLSATTATPNSPPAANLV